MSLRVVPYSRDALASLVGGSPEPSVRADSALRERLRAALLDSRAGAHRRLSAVDVERGGAAPGEFAWSARHARRALATAALARLVAGSSPTLLAAVADAADALVARAQSGRAGSGSLAAWLEAAAPGSRALALAEALGWAGDELDVAAALPEGWRLFSADAYYDVATARVTLRGRRDLGAGGAVVRLRAGAPARVAGSGLRADLAALALADPAGTAPSRLVGVWPEAGVAIALDADDAALVAGARSFARCARERAALAA